MQRVRLFALIFASAMLLSAASDWLEDKGRGLRRFPSSAEEELFSNLIAELSRHYADQISPDSLYKLATQGILESLGDPHTTLMSPESYEELYNQATGEYGGLGIQIDVREGWVTVISAIPNTPAFKAGVKAGDQIVSVNGTSTEGWSADDAVSKLRGPKNTPVEIEIARPGISKKIPLRIVREEIPIHSVPLAYVKEGVGYIEITGFSETTTREVVDAIGKLKAGGMRSLIIDLRRNPGGLLEQGISVSDLFLPEGKLIAETRGRSGSQRERFLSADPDKYPDLPVVLLVGPGTASAAEILAGSLQDHDRALVIGEPTYGKGSVQTLVSLSRAHYLKVTTSRWYTPSGRSIQRKDDVEEGTPSDTFRTASGRPVYGGGGIYPDIIEHDSVDAEVKEFIRQLDGNWTTLQNLIFRFGRENAHLVAKAEAKAEIDDRTLDRFYRALQSNGAKVEREAFEKAKQWLGREIAYQVLLIHRSQEAAQQAIHLSDPQINKAREILKKGTTMESLIALAKMDDHGSMH